MSWCPREFDQSYGAIVQSFGYAFLHNRLSTFEAPKKKKEEKIILLYSTAMDARERKRYRSAEESQFVEIY